MKIEVLGSGCAKCKRLHKNVEKALKKATKSKHKTVQHAAQHAIRRLSQPKREDQTVPHVSGEAEPVKETVVRTEQEWRKLLTPEQYHVLREKGTERPYQNEFDHHFEPGKYACAACGQELFDADTKFNSGCGWPANRARPPSRRVTRPSTATTTITPRTRSPTRCYPMRGSSRFQRCG